MSNEKPNVPKTTTAPSLKMKRVSKVPLNETPEQKFMRLGNARVNRVLKSIEQVGRLCKASQYRHDKRTARAMNIKETLLKAIESAIPATSTVEATGFKIE